MSDEKEPGIFVPDALAKRTDLTGTEKLLVALIDYQTSDTKGCFAKNATLAERVGLTEGSLRNLINDLATPHRSCPKRRPKLNIELLEVYFTDPDPEISRYRSQSPEKVAKNIPEEIAKAKKYLERKASERSSGRSSSCFGI